MCCGLETGIASTLAPFIGVAAAVFIIKVESKVRSFFGMKDVCQCTPKKAKESKKHGKMNSDKKAIRK